MINFFHKIRKKLADDNKPLKYARYAIGEIVLVVIGILIAVQINNWYERGKLRVQEITILKELRADLQQTATDIRHDSIKFMGVLKSNEIIVQHIEDKLPYHDSLNFHFFNQVPFATFSINQSTFENLKNTGFNIISNDSLKIAISNLHTSYFNLYKEYEKRILIEHYENYLRPMVMTQFESFEAGSTKPRNYEDFINNGENLQVMKFTIFMCRFIPQYQGHLLKVIGNLQDQIDKEIDTYEEQNGASE